MADRKQEYARVLTGKVTICRLGYSGDEYTMHIMTGLARTPVKWEEAGWAPQLPSLEIVFDAPVEDFIQTWAQYSVNLNTSINQNPFIVHKTHPAVAGLTRELAGAQKRHFLAQRRKDTKEILFTMKDLKVMKIILESADVCGYAAFIR